MLVALVGNSRVGKDETANILVNKYGFEKRNLAQPIREMLLTINPSLTWVDENEEGYLRETSLVSAVAEWGWDVVKARFPESVEMMISLGQSGRDLISPDIWLDACVREPFIDLCIADCRQPNEAEFVLDHGGELWKVEREGSQVRGMDGLLDDWKFQEVIRNDGTLEDLEKVVASIMGGRN